MALTNVDETICGMKSSRSLTVDKASFEFEWTVTDLLKTRHRYIDAPSFEAFGNEWEISLAPNGEVRRQDREFISISCGIVKGPERCVKITFIAKSPSVSISMSQNEFGMLRMNDRMSCYKFLSHRLIRDHRDNFYKQQKLCFVVHVDFFDAATISPIQPVLQRCVRQEDSVTKCSDKESQKCAICLDRPCNAGYLHGGTAHICVCEKCVKKTVKHRTEKCPICRKRVDQVIYKAF